MFFSKRKDHTDDEDLHQGQSKTLNEETSGDTQAAYAVAEEGAKRRKISVSEDEESSPPTKISETKQVIEAVTPDASIKLRTPPSSFAEEHNSEVQKEGNPGVASMTTCSSPPGETSFATNEAPSNAGPPPNKKQTGFHNVLRSVLEWALAENELRSVITHHSYENHIQHLVSQSGPYSHLAGMELFSKDSPFRAKAVSMPWQKKHLNAESFAVLLGYLVQLSGKDMAVLQGLQTLVDVQEVFPKESDLISPKDTKAVLLNNFILPVHIMTRIIHQCPVFDGQHVWIQWLAAALMHDVVSILEHYGCPKLPADGIAKQEDINIRELAYLIAELIETTELVKRVEMNHDPERLHLYFEEGGDPWRIYDIARMWCDGKNPYGETRSSPELERQLFAFVNKTAQVHVDISDVSCCEELQTQSAATKPFVNEDAMAPSLLLDFASNDKFTPVKDHTIFKKQQYEEIQTPADDETGMQAAIAASLLDVAKPSPTFAKLPTKADSTDSTCEKGGFLKPPPKADAAKVTKPEFGSETDMQAAIEESLLDAAKLSRSAAKPPSKICAFAEKEDDLKPSAIMAPKLDRSKILEATNRWQSMLSCAFDDLMKRDTGGPDRPEDICVTDVVNNTNVEKDDDAEENLKPKAVDESGVATSTQEDVPSPATPEDANAVWELWESHPHESLDGGVDATQEHEVKEITVHLKNEEENKEVEIIAEIAKQETVAEDDGATKEEDVADSIVTKEAPACPETNVMDSRPDDCGVPNEEDCEVEERSVYDDDEEVEHSTLGGDSRDLLDSIEDRFQQLEGEIEFLRCKSNQRASCFGGWLPFVFNLLSIGSLLFLWMFTWHHLVTHRHDSETFLVQLQSLTGAALPPSTMGMANIQHEQMSEYIMDDEIPSSSSSE